MKLFASFLLICCGIFVNAQSLKLGAWSGYIHYDSIHVPFSFEILPSGRDVPEFIFKNGKEERQVLNAYFIEDSLIIPMDPFDVTLRTTFTAMSMEGVYVKGYRNKQVSFHAAYGAPRFSKVSTRPSPVIEEKWEMTFSPGATFASKGVGLFKKNGDRVYGTVLTTTSDYRYFEGILDGDSLKLSSFDGAHAFMIIGKKVGGKQWQGEMIFDNNFSESWEAVYNASAEIPDPFEMVLPEPGQERPYFDLLGAGSGPDAIDPSKYADKVLIIQVFGTWCPNSHDQTEYLVKWYEENKAKDVAILASSYEANYSQPYGLKRIEAYKKSNSISYDVVLGGRLSKRGAATPFPFMDKIEAFPTLVILDKQGYARYVLSYFNGPATGSYYQAFDARFNEIIAQLLEE